MWALIWSVPVPGGIEWRAEGKCVCACRRIHFTDGRAVYADWKHERDVLLTLFRLLRLFSSLCFNIENSITTAGVIRTLQAPAKRLFFSHTHRMTHTHTQFLSHVQTHTQTHTHKQTTAASSNNVLTKHFLSSVRTECSLDLLDTGSRSLCDRRTDTRQTASFEGPTGLNDREMVRCVAPL